jgi:hypothetical protein
MLKVAHLRNFPENCHIKQFFGKDYEDAVKEAEKMGDFLFYYEQIATGKSRTILACYEMVVINEPDTG